MTDWTSEELEDLLADAIDDSMDMDWTSRLGAKSILRELAANGLHITLTDARRDLIANPPITTARMTTVTDPSIRREPFGIVFYAAPDFAALRDAENFLGRAGFSLGSGQRGAPTAVMFGNYSVSKWRNLNQDERRETHATLTGDRRHGPLTFRLLPAAPDEAMKAIEGALAEVTA